MARQLARSFKQNAILYGEKGRGAAQFLHATPRFAGRGYNFLAYSSLWTLSFLPVLFQMSRNSD